VTFPYPCTTIFGAEGNRHRQNSILVCRGHAIGVDWFRQSEDPREASGGTFTMQVAMTFFQRLVLALTLHRQGIVLHLDLNRFGVETRQLHAELIPILGLANIHRRGPGHLSLRSRLLSWTIIEQVGKVFLGFDHITHRTPKNSFHIMRTSLQSVMQRK
jgi:hypothetical protein